MFFFLLDRAHQYLNYPNMSRPAHLPPRYQYQKKSLPSYALSTPQTDQRDDELSAWHHRFPSQSSLLEEFPSWLDDLSSQSETSPLGIPLRRSASDTVAILSGSSTFGSPPSLAIGGFVTTTCTAETQEPAGGAETGSRFEDGYVYGPNSPRHKSKLTQSESSVVSALLENVPQNPFQYLTLDPSCGSETNEFNVNRDACVAVGGPHSEKGPKRHSGQRSRVRKLQYIAELERTVNAFQNLEAQLAATVSSLTQKRLDLSVENTKLKWKITCLEKEKMTKDVQHRALRNEMERLKATHGHHRRSRSTSGFGMGPMEADPSGMTWLTLDMGKLNLGGSPVPTRHGFGS